MLNLNLFLFFAKAKFLAFSTSSITAGLKKKKVKGFNLIPCKIYFEIQIKIPMRNWQHFFMESTITEINVVGLIKTFRMDFESNNVGITR